MYPLMRIVIRRRKNRTAYSVLRTACLVALIAFLLAANCFAEVGKKEDGAVVESTTHVYSKVNPKAGDFLWELEGKPAPRYTTYEREKSIEKANLSIQ